MEQIVKAFISNKQKHLRVFLSFWLLRIISVAAVQTFFVPDEYYQSLEVAHNLVFGYGYITWEWREAIRSYGYPLIFATVYKFLKEFELDTNLSIIYAPRILQALLTAYSDFCFYEWTGNKKWSMFIVACSWFWFYVGSRTLINTFETCLTTIALSKFPWPDGKPKANINGVICLIAILFFIRPTSALIWLPICLHHIKNSRQYSARELIRKYLRIGFSVMFISIILDSVIHRRGTFLLTAYNFLHFNIFKNIGAIYGTHSWYWYITFGLPVVLGIYTLPFVMAVWTISKKPKSHPNEWILLKTIAFALIVMSYLPHKEFRFLTPLLPIIFYIVTRFLVAWSGKAKVLSVWLVSLILFLGNILPIYYASYHHQRGTLDVMQKLNELIETRVDEVNEYPAENFDFLFLMPCHSTPLYSHLHKEVRTRFLTCNPNLNKLSNYTDEADQFYENPTIWFQDNYPSCANLPSHIICFDVLVPFIKNTVLSKYKLLHKIFHCHVTMSSRLGTHVLVYERNDYSPC